MRDGKRYRLGQVEPEIPGGAIDVAVRREGDGIALGAVHDVALDAFLGVDGERGVLAECDVLEGHAALGRPERHVVADASRQVVDTCAVRSIGLERHAILQVGVRERDAAGAARELRRTVICGVDDVSRDVERTGGIERGTLSQLEVLEGVALPTAQRCLRVGSELEIALDLLAAARRDLIGADDISFGCELEGGVGLGVDGRIDDVLGSRLMIGGVLSHGEPDRQARRTDRVHVHVACDDSHTRREIMEVEGHLTSGRVRRGRERVLRRPDRRAPGSGNRDVVARERSLARLGAVKHLRSRHLAGAVGRASVHELENERLADEVLHRVRARGNGVDDPLRGRRVRERHVAVRVDLRTVPERELDVDRLARDRVAVIRGRQIGLRFLGDRERRDVRRVGEPVQRERLALGDDVGALRGERPVVSAISGHVVLPADALGDFGCQHLELDVLSEEEGDAEGLCGHRHVGLR